MVPADLYTQKWSRLTEEEITFIHACADKSILEDCIVISTLYRTYKEANHAAFNDHSNVFLPLMGGFAILDQIGECYKPKGMSLCRDPNYNGIKKALFYFGGYGENDEETKALYAFRNSIMHDCSFVSHSPRDPTRNYWFRFQDDINGCVQLGSEPWNGDYSSCSDKNITLVSRTNFRTLVHNLIRDLSNLHSSNQLDITLSGGANAIRSRYLMRLPR